MDVGSGKITSPPHGFQRLSKKLAASYGLSYRQLYDRIRAGSVEGVVQVEGKGGGWYLPPEIGIPRVRARITPEVEGRILEALRRKQKPAAIAQRERVGVSTVYTIRERHYEALAEDERRRREVQEALDNLPELGTLHRGVGAEHNTAIAPVELAEMNPQYLASIVRFEGYFDPERNTFYVSPALVREIAAWEDVRQKRLEELYRSTMITTGTDKAPKD